MDRDETSSNPLQPAASIVRSIYLSRSSGSVEIGDEPKTLFFRDGELYIDRDDPMAMQISPLLAIDSSRSAVNTELGHAMERLAAELTPNPDVTARLRKNNALVVELVGPLPTVLFVQALATHGCDDGKLLERLGGETIRLRSSAKTPALDQLPGLPPDMAKVLVTLAQPATPADLLRGADSERLAILQGLTKLWSVGLVKRVEEEDRGPKRVWGDDILSPRVLEQFSARIGETLHSDPLELEPEVHRARIADLLGRLGTMDFYQLLGIDPRAGEEEVFAAYSKLARVVHPSHAVRLGLEGKEVAARVIFEKATEAYLTLSDPRRRASYNTVAGVHVQVAVDKVQRAEEKKSIAAQNYRRAASCLSQMDYSLAVDLLKEATRMDPQPEYFSRLGLAQSKNPNWHRHALESYRQAADLAPQDAGIRAGYGKLLEDMEREGEAREQYREALKLMPDHEEARSALERLGGGLSGLSAKSGGFRSLFGRGD